MRGKFSRTFISGESKVNILYLLILLLKILLVIFLCGIGILLLILFIPFKYEGIAYISINIEEKLTAEANLIWMFGLLKIQFLKSAKTSYIKLYISKICMFSKIIGQTLENDASNTETSKSKKRKKLKPKKTWKLSGIKIIFEYFSEILNIVKPKSIIIEGVYGFYDPSITGLIAAITPVISFPCTTLCKVNLNPSFEDEVVDISGKVNGNFFSISIIYRTVSLIIKTKLRKLKIINNN